MAGIWPLTILFARDGIQPTFGTEKEFRDWLGNERGIWVQIAQGNSGWANAINSNISLLDRPLSELTAINIQALSESYRPTQGTLGRFVSRIPKPAIRPIAYSEMVQPGATGGQNSPDLIEGRTLASLYAAIGSNIVGVEQAGEVALELRSSIETVNQLRNSDAEITEKYKSLVTTADADWKNRIEGFAARIALGSPREFWMARAADHRAAADSARKFWDRAFWSILGLLGLTMLVNLLFPPSVKLPS